MATSSVSGTSSNSTSSNVKIVDSSQQGFSGLNSDTFLKILIAQLQNQDPSNPVTNESLVNQLSQMRALQSNIELSDTLKGLSLGQQLTSSAAFIGKNIEGTTDGKTAAKGTVDRVIVSSNEVSLGVGSTLVPLKYLTKVTGA